MLRRLIYIDDDVDFYCQKISTIIKNAMWILMICIWFVYPKC